MRKLFIAIISAIILAVAIRLYLYEPIVTSVEELRPVNQISDSSLESSLDTIDNNPKASESDTDGDKTSVDTEDLPAIYEGSDIPDGVRVDEDGNLIVDADLKLTFDYFLQILGVDGYDPEAMRQLAEQYLTDKLQEPALTYALDLFDRYWDYNVAYNSTQDDEALRQIKETFHGQYESDHLAAIKAFREERELSRDRFFDEKESKGLFSQEREYEAYMDKRMELSASEMNKAERWLKLNELDKTLPVEERQARNQMALVQRYKRYQEIQNDGAMKGMAIDEQLFDEQELSTFKQISESRNRWAELKAAYQTQKQRLIEQGYSDEATLYAALDAYMQNNEFSDIEQRRIKALENRLQP